MSLVSDEEYTRVHSHLEFLINPESLVEHCEKLQRGEERFPSGSDLLKTFLTEASEQDEKQKAPGLRSQNFKKLATRVFQLMSYEVEDLETLLNTKYQRKMLNTLLEQEPTTQTWLLKHRWLLRSLQSPSAAHATLATRSSPPILADKEVSDAKTYLIGWLDDEYAVQRTPKIAFCASFELGEFFFSLEQYSDALKYFNRAQQLLEAHADIATELAKAKQNPPPLASSGTIPASSTPTLTKSTLSLPLLVEKLAAFLKVLPKLMEIPNKSSPHSQLDTAIEQAYLNDKAPDSIDFPSQMVIELLRADNTEPQLSLERRLHLQANLSRHALSHEVLTLNITWRLLHTQDTPSPLWLLGADRKLDLLNSLLQTWNELQQPDALRPRFQQLLVIICEQIGSDAAWTLLETKAPKLAAPNQNLRRLSAASRAFVSDQLNNLSISEADISGSSDFATLTSSREAGALLQAARALSAARGSTLVSAILLQRTRQCESNANYEEANKLFSVLQQAEPNSRDPALFWGRLLTALELKTLTISSEQALQDFKNLFQQEMYPSLDDMEHMMALLLNSKGAVSNYTSYVQQFFKSAASSLSSYHSPLLLLSNFTEQLWRLHQATELLHPSVDAEKVSNAFTQAASHFDVVLSSYLKDPYVLHQLLQRLNDIPMVTTLAAFLLFALAHLYSSSHIPCDVQFDRISKSISSVSAERGHRWVSLARSVSLTDEVKIVEFTLQALQRLLLVSPASSATAFCLGDLHLHKKQHALAMRYYLLAGALDHFSFESPEFVAATPAFIHCLVEAKLYHHAIIMHQYAPKVDYANAFKLCTAWAHLLQFEHFQYLTDITIMEALVYSLKRHGSMAKAHALVDRISRPSFNPNGDAQGATKTSDPAKKRFFQLLTQQLLDGGNWIGDTSSS